MDNKTLWQSLLAAWAALQDECSRLPVNENPKEGFPTLTIWSEADMMLRFSHFLVIRGEVPLEWLHLEVTRYGMRPDMCIMPTAELAPFQARGQFCRSRVLLEAKTPFYDTGTYQYTFQAVVADAKKLQTAVQKGYADGGVLLVLGREQGAGHAAWYLDLLDRTGIGALVHFQYCSTEDIASPPPGFGRQESRHESR